MIYKGIHMVGKRGCMYSYTYTYGRCGLWEEPVRSCGNANQGWETTRLRSEVILDADKNYDDASRDNDRVQPVL